MKKIYKSFVVAVIFVFSASSCTEDLMLEPVSIITNASFWQTEDDAIGGLNGMYTSLRSQAENSTLFILGEARSEVLGFSFSNAALAKYWTNSLNANDPGPEWIGLYNVIHHANLIIKFVPAITFPSEASKNNILAQAYATRAYLYFMLTRAYGDVPLITEPTEKIDANSTQIGKTGKESVFELIKQDIEQAIGLFPDKNFPSGRSIWSWPATQALKADIYLWTGKQLNGGQEDFNTALMALNEVQATDVQLLPVFDDVFRYTNKGNKEIIMAIRFLQFESGSNWGSGSYMHVAYFSPLLDDATLAEIGVMGGSPSYTISASVRSSFTADDQRKNATFYEMFITDPDTNEKSYYGSFSTKYKGIEDAGTRVFVDDIILYRYADILLMKAEVLNALGQDPSVEINMVRARAYGADFDSHVYTNGSKEENDEAILNERLLELALEGKRWWDLVRFDKVFEKVPSLQNRSNDTWLLLFPIPETTLSLNPNLVQNPGY